MTSETVGNVCMHLCMKHFPTLGHSSTRTLQLVKQLIRCFRRVVSHWCAERRGTAEAQIWEVDGRIGEETEGGSECTLSGCREKLFFFQPFSSWHTGEVCAILFEVHRCAHFKAHPTLPACILPETRRYRVSIRWNNGNSHWYTQCLLLHIQYVNDLLKHAHYLIVAASHFANHKLQWDVTEVFSSKPFLVQKSHNIT